MKAKVYSFLLLWIVLALLTACAKPQTLYHAPGFEREGTVYSFKEARTISKERLIKQLQAYPVIFLGDFHNSESVHTFTAELIESLGEQYTLHLANEWFTPSHNEALSLFLNDKLDKKSFLKEVGWKERVGYEFESFELIYNKLKNAKGKMYGINLSKEERRRISLLQTDKMNPKEATFYQSLDMNVSLHQQMLAPYLNHCHAALKDETTQECIDRMYRVQVAWDEKMGQESALIAQKVLKSPKDKLLVFIGAMHLRSGVGVNMRFARYSNKPYATLLPCFEKKLEHGLADYVYYIDPSK